MEGEGPSQVRAGTEEGGTVKEPLILSKRSLRPRELAGALFSSHGALWKCS